MCRKRERSLVFVLAIFIFFGFLAFTKVKGVQAAQGWKCCVRIAGCGECTKERPAGCWDPFVTSCTLPDNEKCCYPNGSQSVCTFQPSCGNGGVTTSCGVPCPSSSSSSRGGGACSCEGGSCSGGCANHGEDCFSNPGICHGTTASSSSSSSRGGGACSCEGGSCSGGCANHGEDCFSNPGICHGTTASSSSSSSSQASSQGPACGGQDSPCDPNNANCCSGLNCGDVDGRGVTYKCISEGAPPCEVAKCRGNACVDTRTAARGGCTPSENDDCCPNDQCGWPGDCSGGGGSCLPNGPTPPAGKSCAPGNPTCDSGCSPSAGNCQNQCPSGYTWCYAGYCIGNGQVPTQPPNPTQTPSCSKKSLGDANCDGNINDKDFKQWKKEYTGSAASKTADFNRDKKVNLIDFEIWRVNQ